MTLSDIILILVFILYVIKNMIFVLRGEKISYIQLIVPSVLSILTISIVLDFHKKPDPVHVYTDDEIVITILTGMCVILLAYCSYLYVETCQLRQRLFTQFKNRIKGQLNDK